MATKKVITHLQSIGSSELKGWAFERLATDPGSPTNGQIWENTTDEVIRFYDGTTTKTLVSTALVSSETVAGIIELATSAEAIAGTDTERAITPATLAAVISGLALPVYTVNLDSAEADVTRVFAGGQTTYTVVHAQNYTSGYVPDVKEISTGESVIADVISVDANTVDVVFNGNSTDNTFKLTLVGS